MIPNPTPTFVTRRLTLRAPTMDDAESYQRHFADYEVISQLAAQVPWPYPADGAKEYLKTVILPDQGDDIWFWGIYRKENPEEIIGGVSLWRDGQPENRGFWLGREFWGRGYMTEAVAPVMDYAFNSLGFEKLVLTNALGNTRSRRVKEKTGARLIDVRPAKFVNPAYTEHEVWELTRSEWESFKTCP